VVRLWEISPILEAFSIDENENFNVHIFGEAFSDFQGFMEGSLRSAHNVMTKMQGITVTFKCIEFNFTLECRSV